MQKVKVKVSEVKSQFGCFRTGDEIMRKAWCVLGEVPYSFQGQRQNKIFDFDPNWAFTDCNSSLNSLMATKGCTKLEKVGDLLFFKVVRQI